MNYNRNSGYGAGLVSMVSSIIPTFGRIFVVMSATDAGEENYDRLQQIMKSDPDGQLRFFNTIALAYAEVTSNNNDVILLDADTSHSEAILIVAKNRVHFIGMDGGGRLNSQGAKWSVPATGVAGSTAVVKNTGTRNTYRNIKFIQQGTNAAQLNSFDDTGEGTYMKNCSIHHNSLLTTANKTSLKFAGDTCHYEDCEIGNSTVINNIENQAPLVLKTPARYSYFINCTFIQYSLKTTASCIDAPDADSVIGWVHFKNCALISANLGDGATAGGTMAEGVTSICESGYLYFDNNCSSFNATLFAEKDASILLASADGGTAGEGGAATAAA